ncbi:MAG: hypothetical protein B7Z80_07815 [Rhodospirillales bacterium 20-64-7]|nr:MAG: hypothetical protein B7Z80_07815 [Rhodospirillales bacterium 20-64-7]
MFGAGLLGLMIGALLFGSPGEEWRRPPVLALATFAFAPCTVAPAFAGDIVTLTPERSTLGLARKVRCRRRSR